MPMKYWLTALFVTWILGQADEWIKRENGVKEYKGRHWIMGPSVVTMIIGLGGFFTWLWAQS